MDAKDRLAYEVAMAGLQDAREDCLRWLEDQDRVVTHRRPARWLSFRVRPTPKHALTS
jgi:hypothetical protein